MTCQANVLCIEDIKSKDKMYFATKLFIIREPAGKLQGKGVKQASL